MFTLAVLAPTALRSYTCWQQPRAPWSGNDKLIIQATCHSKIYFSRVCACVYIFIYIYMCVCVCFVCVCVCMCLSMYISVYV